MTVGRRLTLVISGALVLLAALAGVGIGATAWVRAWKSDYVAAAGVQAAANPTLQTMLNTLSSRALVFMVVLIVLAVVGLVLGTSGAALLNRTISQRLRTAVRSLTGSAQGLLAVASQVAAASAETAASTSETTATVEEVRQTAELAQEKAEEGVALSEKLVEQHHFGARSAEANYAHFEQIRAEMEVVTEAINRLIEQAESAGEVISSVNDIAEQSNLLSVNASVEAAKAGETGKGFAVVAQEIKNLAAQSKQAVSQVRNVLNDIRRASETAMEAVEHTRLMVEAGRAEAQSARDSLTERIALTNRNAEAMTQIAVTSRQQLAGIEHINRAMVSINEAGKQLADGTQQVEKEAQRLRELALDLTSFVSGGETE